MIKQNHVKCYPVIQRVGCFCRSCGGVAEFITGQELSAEQINQLWDWGKHNGFIDLKDEIKASAPIINRALQVLGGTGKVYEIGTFRGKMNYYKGVSETMKKRPKYYIQKIQTANKNAHFRIVNYDGKVIFDPYDPAPKAIKIEYSIIYAYNGEAK